MTILNYKFFAASFDPAFVNTNESFEGAARPGTAIYIALPVLYLTLQIAIFSLLFWRYSAKFLAILLLVITIISSYFITAYSAIIDDAMLTNALSTDLTELKDLFSPLMLAFLAGLALLSALILRAKITPSPLKYRLLASIVALAIFGGVFGAFSKDLIPFFRTHNAIRFYNLPYYPIYSLAKLARKNAPNEPFVELTAGAALGPDAQKEVFLLIIGETARSANIALNGYRANDTSAYTRPLNPVSFTDFAACGTSTAVSLPCMVSDLTREDFSIAAANNRSNLLDIAQTAGASVACLENNSGSHKGICARVSDTEEHGGDGPDEVLLAPIKARVAAHARSDSAKPLLLMVHLQGSHGPSYFRRYPKEFARFLPTCETTLLKECDQNAIINTYDNTILYTDYLLAQMIDILKTSGVKSGLFYISDHGESLGEKGIYLHGTPYFIAPDYQIKVPAIMWFSDPKLMAVAQKSKDAPLSHDHIFSTILGLLNISSPAYWPELDFMRDDFARGDFARDDFVKNR